MSGTILVAYGTTTGTTHEVADAIAAELRAAGRAVDVLRADQARSLDSYSAAVVGTNIKAGMLSSQVKAFMRRHARKLADMPVAYFVVCATMSDPTDKNCTAASAYLEKLKAMAPAAKPRDTALFGGWLKTDGEDFQRANVLLKAMVRRMAPSFKDGRDWDAIRAWARGLSAKLAAN